MNKKHKLVSYAKWGYIFIAPFFVVYIVFQLIPLLSTFYYSFFENYR
ncbi:MAG: sugar ABC transporter permease, partial [[Eubacterium] siraeum]|nr:sugar ABC transporter permease [[Eubacterium] siraeum]